MQSLGCFVTKLGPAAQFPFQFPIYFIKTISEAGVGVNISPQAYYVQGAYPLRTEFNLSVL